VYASARQEVRPSVETEYKGDWITNLGDNRKIVQAASRVQLVAGTAWLFAHEGCDGLVDTLVIDEAGQVSLADALATCTAARNVILLGDPSQLAQVSQGTHPEGTGLSVLEHLLGVHQTVPATWGSSRPHAAHASGREPVRLRDRVRGPAQRPPELATQATAFGTGLRFLPVEHVGNVAAAPEEPSAWHARSGRCWAARGPTARARRVAARDRLHGGRALQRAGAPAAPGAAGRRLGAVPWHRRQVPGLEAPVVFYSMATSSAEDVPRTLDFLFSRNRLNVAVSRAMCLAFIVASPRLLESKARTVEQMRADQRVVPVCGDGGGAIGRNLPSECLSADRGPRPPPS